ncbi:MAG TPA: 4-(cytidine 5'-diphospho)-2-C-methyl-D-erythritol kinase [Desulfarculaceae bacterium]|nr:4-(cytidine 5'-diphospho)-2-C-methyl-D-erythritol kinase [Desulfarculaceae bacterium]
MVLPATFSAFIITPAKVNLGLKIVRRRDDGYHDIYTVMEPVSLVDTIYCEFHTAPEDSISFQSPQMMEFDAESNLVVKAARRMVARAREQGLSIHGHWNFWLEKKIPAGAGLGGGSSNAAGIINLLNDFYKLGLESDELIAIAVVIGADIPFFLAPELSLIEGIGDRITPLKQAQRRYYLLIKPAFSINTGWAYSSLNAPVASDFSGYDIDQFSGEPEALSYSLENDFEVSVMASHPQLAEIKAWLAESPGSLGALMSGSGSVVYAVYSELAPAVRAEADARQRWQDSGCEFFLARNLNLFHS